MVAMMATCCSCKDEPEEKDKIEDTSKGKLKVAKKPASAMASSSSGSGHPSVSAEGEPAPSTPLGSRAKDVEAAETLQKHLSSPRLQRGIKRTLQEFMAISGHDKHKKPPKPSSFDLYSEMVPQDHAEEGDLDDTKIMVKESKPKPGAVTGAKMMAKAKATPTAKAKAKAKTMAKAKAKAKAKATAKAEAKAKAKAKAKAPPVTKVKKCSGGWEEISVQRPEGTVNAGSWFKKWKGPDDFMYRTLPEAVLAGFTDE